MSKLAEYGLTIKTTAKGKCWLWRDDLGVGKITALQRDLLEWLDGAPTPSLVACCEALWEQVDPEWVRSQWDRLASLMTPLGVAVVMDDCDTLFLALVDREGMPMQPVLEHAPAAVDVPAARPSLTIAPEIVADIDNELAGLRLEIERLRDLNRILVEQRNDAQGERDRLAATVEELGTLNVSLAGQRKFTLAALSDAEETIRELREQGQTQPSAEIVHLRDYPAKIAPHYLTVPVSEALFRWLEASGDRNRRSADDMARVLLVAFMKATGNREAA